MMIKNRLKKLERITSREARECISAWSGQELKEKLEGYRQKYPHKSEPFTIVKTIIKSRNDLEEPEL